MYTSMYIFTYVYDIDIYAYTTYILTWCAARGDREGYTVALALLPPRALGELAACRFFVRPFKFMYFLCAAVCCSVLQCVGVRCSVLQCAALQIFREALQIHVLFVCCSVLQCVVVRCCVLQCAGSEIFCHALQIHVCCSVL